MAIATNFGKNALAEAYADIALYGAICTTAPSGSTFGTEVTGGTPAYARKAIIWSAAAAGVITGSVTFDVPAGTTVRGVGVFDAVTAGNYVDGKTETDVTFSVQDTVTVNYTFTEV